MKINKTIPEETQQWASDSPSVKAMRFVLPVAAALSAFSLAGGIAGFFELGFTTLAGVALFIVFVIAAFGFDKIVVVSAQAIVREFMIKNETGRNFWFWFNMVLTFAIVIGGGLFSFNASRDGVGYAVLKIREAQEVQTQTDTTLTATIAGATDQNAGILQAKQTAYNAQVEAINALYGGKLEALNAEIERREKQRTKDNTHYIDQLIQKLKKRIGDTKAEQGKELASLSAAFADDQADILAKSDTLQSIVVADAQAAADRRKLRQNKKDQADAVLSALVGNIFGWSIVFFILISVRLTVLETRNGILPKPILSNFDVSGFTSIVRLVTAPLYFVFACLAWVAEWMIRVAPKLQTPIVDNDIVDWKTSQAQVIAIRKELKESKKLAAAQYREIGFGKVGAIAENVGSAKVGTGQIDTENLGSAKVGTSIGEPQKSVPQKVGTREEKLDNKGVKISAGEKVGTKKQEHQKSVPKKSGSEKVGTGEDEEMSEEKREAIKQVKLSKKLLTKYKKRQAASYQKIEQARAAGEEPKHQQLKAYENRTQKVKEIEAEIRQLEAQLNSMS